jgi:hypothetical protein
MARLIYSTITSLDGYIEDERGEFAAWARPDDEVASFINGLEKGVGTYLYGRRLYETMVFWETVPVEGSPPEGSPADPGESTALRDFPRM